MHGRKRLLSAREAAELSNSFSESTLRRAITGGDIPPACWLRLNNRLYVRRAAFERWLDAQDSEQAEQPERQPDALRLVKASER